jgi:predicted phage terminase large subunit-like protein
MTPDTQQWIRQVAAKELLRRDNALASMWEYQRFLSNAHADFTHTPADHHDKIIEALHALERDECKGVLICAPPGSAKSTYVSVQFATWMWARHPTYHILACSNTTDLAETFNRRRRNVCYTPAWEVLADCTVDKTQQGVARFANTAGGTMTAAGVGSAIVGLRSDLNILDDPIQSFEQAMSLTQLGKIWDWFETDFRSRLLPTGKEVIVTTRWAKRDPAGRILDLIASGQERGWKVLILPMISEDGAPLWPSWYGRHQIEQNQRDPLRWSALYQQRPLDESGAWVPFVHLHIEDAAPDELTYIMAVDLALSVGAGDFTVFTVCGLDSERNVHVVDVYRDRIPPNESAEVAFELCHRHNPTVLLIDDDNSSKVWMRLVHELARARNASIPIYPLPMRGKDKETRAAAIRGFLLADRVKLVRAPWNADVIREILEFPGQEHDDVVDALGLIGRHLVSASSPTPPMPRNHDPWAGWLIRPDQPDVMQCSLDELFEAKPQRSLRI